MNSGILWLKSKKRWTKSDGVQPKKKLIRDLCVVLTYKLQLSEHYNACRVMLNLGPDGKETKYTPNVIEPTIEEELLKLTLNLKSEGALKLVTNWRAMFVIGSL